MLRALSLSIGQLADRAFLSVLAKSLLITLAIFAVLGIGLFYLLDWLIARFAWQGEPEVIALLTLLLILLSAWLLFRIVAIGVINLFADAIVAAVERKHYPDAADRATSPPIALQARVALGSVGRAIGYNLLALPLYILLLVTGVGPIILAVALNGWLLSRDLSELVLVRHRPRAEWRDWMRAKRGERYALGLVAALLFVVPFVNLLAPILGAAMATHMFHGGKTA